MRSLQRFFVYLILLLGSITFLAPLLWMLSTGLKPIDQAMTMPPTWIPYRFFVEKDGTRVEVKHGGALQNPPVVVKSQGGGPIVPPRPAAQGQIEKQHAQGRTEIHHRL